MFSPSAVIPDTFGAQFFREISISTPPGVSLPSLQEKAIPELCLYPISAAGCAGVGREKLMLFPRGFPEIFLLPQPNTPKKRRKKQTLE